MTWTRKLIVVLAMALVTLGALELLLRVADPFGAHYYEDMIAVWETRLPDPTGFTHRPGVYDVGGRYTFTIEPDGLRAAPSRTSSGPRVTFIGDSVTFGSGVDDA